MPSLKDFFKPTKRTTPTTNTRTFNDLTEETGRDSTKTLVDKLDSTLTTTDQAGGFSGGVSRQSTGLDDATLTQTLKDKFLPSITALPSERRFQNLDLLYNKADELAGRGTPAGFQADARELRREANMFGTDLDLRGANAGLSRNAGMLQNARERQAGNLTARLAESFNRNRLAQDQAAINAARSAEEVAGTLGDVPGSRAAQYASALSPFSRSTDQGQLQVQQSDRTNTQVTDQDRRLTETLDEAIKKRTGGGYTDEGLQTSYGESPFSGLARLGLGAWGLATGQGGKY